MTGDEDVYDFSDFSHVQHVFDPVLQQLEFHALCILSWSLDAGAVSFTYWTCALRNELTGSRSRSGCMRERRISSPVANQTLAPRSSNT